MNRILLDLRYKVRSGVSSCIRDLVPVMLSEAARFEIGIIRYEEQCFDFQGDVCQTLICPARTSVSDIYWTNVTLPSLLEQNSFDLYHGMKWTGPINNPVKSVYTAHSILYPFQGERLPLDFKSLLYLHSFHKRGVRRVDTVIAVSDFVEKFFTDAMRIPRNKVCRIYNGINPICREYNSVEKQQISASRSFGQGYLLCVGNLVEVKNHILAIKALKQIEHRTDINLVIAGGDPYGYRSVLEQAATSADIGHRVFFPGFVSGKELVDLYNGALALIHPSISEGLALATLEAARCGLPIIGTRCRGNVEVFSDAAIFIESEVDAAGLAASVMRLKSDNEYRRSKIRASSRAVRDFDWTTTAREYLGVYEDLLSVSR